ncbi:MAG: SGNH/GDSL hydrolase family protein [Rectinemataceae bacterium]
MLPSTVCMFGDSVARGIVLDETGKYSPIRESFGALAASRLGIELVNKSRFGCTITKGRELLAHYLARAASPAPSVALLEFGGNDCDFHWDQIAGAPREKHEPLTPIETFGRIYRDMIDSLRANCITPILMTLPPLEPERYFAWFTRTGLDGSAILSWLGDVHQIYRWHERYNEAVWETALDKDCPIVDIRAAFLEHKNYRDYICNDGIHPNKAGHRLIEEALLAGVANLVAKRDLRSAQEPIRVMA